MLPDLSGKFGKLQMPEGSLIKKLERIKKSSGQDTKTPLFPGVIDQLRDQLRKAHDDVTKQIEDLVNSKTEQIKANAEAVKNLESQISKMEQTFSSGKKGTEEFKERLDKIDETVLELLSLYEVVSSTVNPFVGDKPNPVTEKLAEIEKKVEELGQKTPQDLTQGLDNKFKTLENNIEELKKAMGSNGVNEDALVEKVAGKVLENIKPAIGQRSWPLRTSNSVEHQTVPQYEDDQGIRLPFLDNRPETSIILLNWLEFLMEKVGRNNLIDVLEYYIEIGWISEEVSSRMTAYASGIDYYVERPTWKLLPEDHTKSLLFIEQLRGRKIDKNLFSRLERDVDKIIRSNAVLVP